MMTGKVYTINDLEKDIKDAYAEHLADPWTEDWQDAISELADGLTPIYFNDCFRLAMESTEISHFDLDIGLVGDDIYPARIVQVAIYEWIRSKLYELFEADKAD